MSTTNFTATTRIRQAINDVLQDTDGDTVDDDLRSLLSDEQIEEFIVQNIRQQEAVYVFQRLGTASNYFRYFSLTEQQHFFDPTFDENTDILTTGVSTNGAPSATVLTAAASTFVTDGVEVGDLVTNTTTGETATVVSVDSETQITTGAIVSSYTALDAFTVTRVVVYEMHSNGYIKVDSSTVPETSIAVTATIVHVGYVLYDIFMYLAHHYAQKANFRVVGTDVAYDSIYSNLVKQAHLARGVYSV